MRYLALFLTLVLAGCGAPGAVVKFTPVCDALIGPIRYNSTNKASPRHAGPELAPELKARNQVGQGLNCPAYK